MDKSIVFFLCALLCFYSCKKHEFKGESVFKVVMEVQSDTNATFQMYYMEEGDEKFVSDKVVEGDITESSLTKVEFKLPKKSFPKSLRFDFDTKDINQSLTFVSMKMTYEDLNMDLSSIELYAFFIPNEYLSFNKETGEINFKIIKGKSDPYFKARPLFNKKLELEKR